MNNKHLIYLDNNATTPLDKRVLEAMMPFLTAEYANANSIHLFGISAHEAVEKARTDAAELIGAEPQEIIFTSGATEAINMAIKGVAENYTPQGKHIITSSTEHSAVLDTCRYLETRGFEVTYLPVLSDGLIDLNVLKNALREDTILVSIMLANNETGVIQPIGKIAEIAREVGALVMTDSTQAVGKIPIDVDEMGIDLLCMSGHKIYGPKGVGALYIRQREKRIKIPALIHGGGHERGFRSGTLNVPGIVGFGKACEIAMKEMEQDEKRIKDLRKRLEDELLKNNGAFVNGNQHHRIYNVSNICFPGIDGDSIITRETGLAIASGSACTSALIEPSYVLLSMGLTKEDAFASIRFSLGRFNTKEDIENAIKLFQLEIIKGNSLA